jgi:hypothetical protein
MARKAHKKASEVRTGFPESRRLLAAHRIGELVPAEQGKRTDLKTSPKVGEVPHQRLSEFRKLAGAMIAPKSGDYKTIKMVRDAPPGLFTGDLKRVWDRLKIGSRLNESRLKSLSRLNGMVNPRKRIICKRFLVFEWDRLKSLSPLRETVNPRKRIICKRFLVFEWEYPLKAALPNLGGPSKGQNLA